jgi:hypothetical protein
MEEFDTSGAGMHPNWPDRFFARIVGEHLKASGNRGGKVGDAASFYLSARELLEFAGDVMERVAADAGAAAELEEMPE